MIFSNLPPSIYCFLQSKMSSVKAAYFCPRRRWVDRWTKSRHNKQDAKMHPNQAPPAMVCGQTGAGWTKFLVVKDA
jgi:hypothetical protein